jgi:ribonuclease T2
LRRAAQAFAALFLCCNTAAAQPGDFDFYVLSLSWSPSWCATAPAAEKSPQCDEDGDFGFVVHGLWPQYETGYPEYCEADGRVSASVAASMLDIMPDRALVAHEWRKHGSCSGLSPKGYFAETRAAFERLRIPHAFRASTDDRRMSAEAIETAFVAANPGMSRDGIAVSCGGGMIEEVRICLARNLMFRPCREVDMRGCRQQNLKVPAAE